MVGELNKGVVVLLLVMVFGAAGYLWYQMLYTPAVEDRTTAAGEQQTAEAALSNAQTKLAAAQRDVEESKKDAGKIDDSVSKVQVARKAVPSARLVDDAAIVLTDLADRAGIRTGFDSGDASSDSAAGAAGGGPQGATPIDLTFEAVGKYDNMMLFMRLVEGTVSAEDGKLYARDRLFNVVKLELGSPDADAAGSSDGGFASGDFGAAERKRALVAGPDELKFTVTVRMYSSSRENAQTIGEQTPDPAAAATDPTNPAGAGGAGADASGTDPSIGADAGAGTGGQPGAGTDPAAGAGGGI